MEEDPSEGRSRDAHRDGLLEEIREGTVQGLGVGPTMPLSGCGANQGRKARLGGILGGESATCFLDELVKSPPASLRGAKRRGNLLVTFKSVYMGLQIDLIQLAAPRTGLGTFSGVTGGRALSFHGVSMGETPGPKRMRGEQREGAKLPRR